MWLLTSHVLSLNVLTTFCLQMQDSTRGIPILLSFPGNVRPHVLKTAVACRRFPPHR